MLETSKDETSFEEQKEALSPEEEKSEEELDLEEEEEEEEEEQIFSSQVEKKEYWKPEELGDIFSKRPFSILKTIPLIAYIYEIKVIQETGIRKFIPTKYLDESYASLPLNQAEMEELLPPGRYLIRLHNKNTKDYIASTVVRISLPEITQPESVFMLETRIKQLETMLLQLAEALKGQQQIEDPKQKFESLVYKLLEKKLMDETKQEINLQKIAEQVSGAIVDVQKKYAELDAELKKKQLDLQFEAQRQKTDIELKKLELQLQGLSTGIEEKSETEDKEGAFTKFLSGLQKFAESVRPVVSELRKIQELQQAPEQIEKELEGAVEE